MSEKVITQTEYDLLSSAINSIINTEVIEYETPDHLPLPDEMVDTNKAYRLKASVLFVDMRGSTKLPAQFDSARLIKIYRSYIRTVVQAIRYSGGYVKDFMGDGVLAVFLDDDVNSSSEKAVAAARYLATAIDKVLNPLINQEFSFRVSCGIGIHTGEVSMSKVGMRGKDPDDNANTEYGIAWIGNSTNYACKYSGAVAKESIFINDTTYAELKSKEKAQIWKEIEVIHGKISLKGYFAKNYYLQTPKEIEPCIAEGEYCDHSLIETLQEEYREQIQDIRRKSEELGRREQILKGKEKQVRGKEEYTTALQENLELKKGILESERYDFYTSVIGSGHCKTEYVKAMGIDFWEEYLEKAVTAGEQIGKSRQKVYQEISYAMVYIYGALEIYNKAYDFLVEQVNGFSWISLYTVQNIVRKSGKSEMLKSALYSRLARGDISSNNLDDFKKAKNWLVFEYKK